MKHWQNRQLTQYVKIFKKFLKPILEREICNLPLSIIKMLPLLSYKPFWKKALNFQLASALADLGGLTGLWIGASVVSLLEIVALIVYTVQAYVRKKKMSYR